MTDLDPWPVLRKESLPADDSPAAIAISPTSLPD